MLKSQPRRGAAASAVQELSPKADSGFQRMPGLADAAIAAPSSGAAVAPAAFEPEFVHLLQQLFDERIAFNRLLGVRLDEVTPVGTAHCSLAMHSDLVGHPAYGRLHGGVISAVLDAVAGMAIIAAMGARHMDEAPRQRLQRFLKLGTIDLRVDYLRAGIGTAFTADARVLRLGSRVAVTRMEFLGADGVLLAVGAGNYIVS